MGDGKNSLPHLWYDSLGWGDVSLLFGNSQNGVITGLQLLSKFKVLLTVQCIFSETAVASTVSLWSTQDFNWGGC